jgi:hypothetical protein
MPKLLIVDCDLVSAVQAVYRSAGFQLTCTVVGSLYILILPQQSDATVDQVFLKMVIVIQPALGVPGERTGLDHLLATPLLLLPHPHHSSPHSLSYQVREYHMTTLLVPSHFHHNQPHSLSCLVR